MSATASYNSIEKLDEDNYDAWKVQMKSVLICNDLWGFVIGKIVKPEGEADIQSWVEKDEKALATILLAVKSSQLIHVKKAKTASEAWNILESIHQPSGPSRKVMLFRQLLQLRLEENEAITSHVNSFSEVIEKLSEVGIVFQDELLVIIMLASLPKSYENFTVAIESRDVLPSFASLRVKLMEEGKRRRERADGAVHEQAFYTKQSRPRSKQESTSSHTEKRRTKSKRDVECYICRKRGHYAVECREKKNKIKEYNGVFAMLNMNMDESNNLERQRIWILDSGATCHMCCNDKVFSSMKKHIEKVQLAGGYVIESTGIGAVDIDTPYGNVLLQDVLYVPELGKNFISLGKATAKGLDVVFSGKIARIKTKDNQTILVAKKSGNLFLFENTVNKCFSLETKGCNNVLTWHNRYGHLNGQSLSMLSKNKLVRGIEFSVHDDFEILKNCETCIKAKIKVSSFPKHSETRRTKVLELIHSDICGPMQNKSLGGAKYFVTFIDDYSRKIFVYMLKEKSQVFSVFKEFKERVENETGSKIKMIRSDNAKEYLSQDFSNYLKRNGIRRQLSIEYTPQQNGVAERANRTLVEMARCMLIDGQLPEYFWGEAINTAAYIRNRCPTKLLRNVTPQEAWNGRKPSVSHLKIFGSKAIMLIKRPGNSKFKPKGTECIFVGYCEESKGYRLYEKTTKRIHKSRDVRFLENVNSDKNLISFNKNPEQGEEMRLIEEAEKPHTNKSISSDLPNEEIAKTITLTESESENVGRKEIYKDTDSEEKVWTDEDPFKIIEENEICEENSTTVEETQSQDKSVAGGSVEARNRGGRPEIIRTGKRGRPRKVMSVKNRVNMVHAKSKMRNPCNVKEATSGIDAHKWKSSMKKEYNSLIANNTWTLTDLPKGRKPIKCKWVFNLKTNKEGNVDRYKSRLVAKGCSQLPNVDFKETFSPVARFTTIRCVLALAVEYGLLVHQIDVSSAYLNSTLKEEIYMEQPERFVDSSAPDKVCKLNKALYGLKQSGREWNAELDKTLRNLNFKPCTSDSCAYVNNERNRIIIIIVYVDDILIVSSDKDDLDNIKAEIGSFFDIVDKGPVEYFLGMEISREGERGTISVCQKQFIELLLERNGMSECKGSSTPLPSGLILKKCNECNKCIKPDQKTYQSIIGSLMYLGLISRPDIIHAVTKLAQFNQDPHIDHMRATKHILRYLSNTKELSLVYRKTGNGLYGFADADWAGCPDDRKSFTGFAFIIGGAAVSWQSKKQHSVALSSTEAEYMAMSEASKEIVFLRSVIHDLGFEELNKTVTTLYGDNLSAHQLVKNPCYHARTKHIDVRVHYIREVYKKGQLEIKYLPTADMTADVLTKPLPKIKHVRFVKSLGLL